MRPAPAGLGLEHVAPERDFAENPADGGRIVPPDDVRQGVDRVAGRVETTRAQGIGHGVRPRTCFEGTALGERRLSHGPVEVVEDRAEPEAVGGLGHEPGTPTNDDLRRLAKRVTDLHE